jgi:hypothetical protein
MISPRYIAFKRFLCTIETIGCVDFKLSIQFDNEQDLRLAIDDLINKSMPFKVNGFNLIILGA